MDILENVWKNEVEKLNMGRCLTNQRKHSYVLEDIQALNKEHLKYPPSTFKHPLRVRMLGNFLLSLIHSFNFKGIFVKLKLELFSKS